MESEKDIWFLERKLQAHTNRGKINFVLKDNVHGQAMKIKDSS